MNSEKDIYYNHEGVLLTEEITQIVRTQAFIDDGGRVNWSLIQYGDEDGFDKRYVEQNGSYVQSVVLPPEKRILRYGFPMGRFTTDVGTDYELLSLPYIKESMPYHEYIVQKACEVECRVIKGVVAPGFGSVGGAIQYKHPITIGDSIESGILKENYEWIRSKLNR